MVVFVVTMTDSRKDENQPDVLAFIASEDPEIAELTALDRWPAMQVRTVIPVTP